MARELVFLGARHHDPLRIWLAQLATDLQWPSRSARDRFDAWLIALELARDEEARRAGADGADLAAAILATLRIAPSPSIVATAELAAPGLALRERVARLLSPLPRESIVPPRTSIVGWLVYPCACGLGVLCGEIVIGLALRVVP